MFTLIKNANLYSPEHLGMNDVLLADDKAWRRSGAPF